MIVTEKMLGYCGRLRAVSLFVSFEVYLINKKITSGNQKLFLFHNTSLETTV